MKSDKISRLVTENINLIYLVMKRFRNRGVDREDLFQIGAVGLTKAAQRFVKVRLCLFYIRSTVDNRGNTALST